MKPPPFPSSGKASHPLAGSALKGRGGALLAEGSLSCVYELIEYQGAPVSRPLVLKQIKSAFVHDPQIREQLTLLRERRSELIHPNLCERVEVHIDEHEIWTIEQRVEGQSLASLLEERGRMSLADAQQIWQQLAKALLFLHQQGLRHTDLKPCHVMVAKAGDGYKVTLIDAGLGRPLSETLVGTPAYLAPELVRSANPRPSARSDIFAYGCVVYEMLFRQRAFPAQTLLERRLNLNADPGHHFLTGEDQPKTAAVRSALFSALEESPDRRPAKIADLVARLDAACSPSETVAIGTTPHVSTAPSSSAGHRILTPVREPARPPNSDSGQLTPPNPNIHRTPEPRPVILSQMRYVTASLVLGICVAAGLVAWLPEHKEQRAVSFDLATSESADADEPLDQAGQMVERSPEESLDAGGLIPDLRADEGKEPERREPRTPKPKLRCRLNAPASLDKRDLEAMRSCSQLLPTYARMSVRAFLKRIPKLREVVATGFPDSYAESHKSFFECTKNIRLVGSIPPEGVSYVCE